MKIARRTNGLTYTDLFFIEEELHKGPRGYFLIASGNAGTLYSRRTGLNSRGPGTWKIRLTPELAQRWLKGEFFVEMYRRLDEAAHEAMRSAKRHRG